MDQDLALYQRFLSGERQALETLVALHTDNLIRFAYLYLKDSSAAEDVAEDTFVALLLKKKIFLEGAKFKTYLYRIARNKCIDLLRKRKKIVPLQDVENVLHGGCFETEIHKKEQYATLYRCMWELPAQYNEILHLTYFDGFTVKEICAITKQSAKQVYNLLSRAKHSLKQLLIKEGVNEP